MKEKVYCEFCGKVNSPNNLVCKSCGEKLGQKDTQVRDYFNEVIKARYKKEEVNAIDYFIYFCSKLIYPIILIVFIVIVSILLFSPKKINYDAVYEKSDKVSFNGLSDSDKLLGCFKGESEEDTWYYKFISKDKVNYYYKKGNNLVNDLYYYDIKNSSEEGANYSELYMGSLTNIESMGYFLWEEDGNVWVTGKDLNEPIRNVRIKCEDIK